MQGFIEVCQVLEMGDVTPDVVFPVCNSIQEQMQSMNLLPQLFQEKQASVMKSGGEALDLPGWCMGGGEWHH